MKTIFAVVLLAALAACATNAPNDEPTKNYKGRSDFTAPTDEGLGGGEGGSSN